MTTALATQDDATTEALAAGLLSAETGRRVGWARAYEALARVESLEEQTRQMTDELKVLRRAYSRLLGFINTVPLARSPILDAELAAHIAAEKSFRTADAWDAGVALGHEHRSFHNGWTVEQIESDRAHRAANARYRKAKHAELYEAGEALGHRVDVEDGTPRCTCGLVLDGDPSDVKREHISLMVHGVGFKALQRRWEKQRQAETGAA